MTREIANRLARVVGWILIGLGVAGLLLGIVVLTVTAVSSSGTDDPTTYVMLLIVAASQLLLGAAILWVLAGSTPNTDPSPPSFP